MHIERVAVVRGARCARVRVGAGDEHQPDESINWVGVIGR